MNGASPHNLGNFRLRENGASSALPLRACLNTTQRSAMPEGCYWFGRIELNTIERVLLVDGAPVKIGSRAFDVLQLLVERRDRVVTKSELLDAVWPGLVVEENNLQVHISTLRKLLGSSAIATISGRGYRFAMSPKDPREWHPSTEPTRLPFSSATRSVVHSRLQDPHPTNKLKHNLPATLTPLLGRGEDMAALDELIDQHRLVSVVGAGGMGKTLVAQHLTVGRLGRFSHGVCWVELAAIDNAELLPDAIGRAIGVEIGSSDPLGGLCNALRPLTMLVTLDNAEHIVDGVARAVQALLDQAPGLRFLVTSQAPLKLICERTYRIDALAVPSGPLPLVQALEFSAVALFAERAQAADSRFRLTEVDVGPVTEICRQLDGLPLAIELAASRAQVFGVQRLAASMGDRFSVLTSSRNRLAPARQQALRAALEWSYSVLDERERLVLRRLAVFANSASLSMVSEVVGEPKEAGDLDLWQVRDALAILVERSLVVAITADGAVEPRYQLLDSPRVFAKDKLREALEETALKQRHAVVVAAHFLEAQRVLDSGAVPRDQWKNRMAADLGNGREALGWARSADDALRVVQIAMAMARALPPSAYAEGVALTEECAPLVERLESAYLLASVCAVYGNSSSNPHHVLALIHRCVDRLPPDSPTDDDELRFSRYSMFCSLAGTERWCGNVLAAENALAKARQLVDAKWPSIRRRKLVIAEGALAAGRGDALAARRWALRRVELDVAVGDSHPNGRINLIDAELAASDAAAAIVAGLALLADLSGGRNEYGLVLCRMMLGAAYLVVGDLKEATPQLRAGWAQAAIFDLDRTFADWLALLAARDERFGSAARLAGYADCRDEHFLRRDLNEAAAIAQAVHLARSGLGDATFDALYAEGRGLRHTDIDALAFRSA